MSGLRSRLVRWTGYVIFFFITTVLPLNFIVLWFVNQKVLTDASYYVTKTPVFSYLIPDLKRGEREQVLFVGDSHAQGAGDAYRDRVHDYSLAHMYAAAHEATVHMTGKGGYGSLRAARNAIWLDTLFRRSLFLRDMPTMDRAVVLFYEGNDLNNNIHELKEFRDPDSPQALIDRSQPTLRDIVVDGHLAGAQALLYTFNDHTVRPLFDRAAGNDPHTSEDTTHGHVDITVAGETRRVPPMQSAAVELDDAQLDRALKAFEDSVAAVRQHFRPKRLDIVYIPSPLTVYPLQGEVRIQPYHAKMDSVDAARNAERSRVIRSRIAAYAQREGIALIDPTEAMQAAAHQRFLHGPKDSKHPNLDGYRLIFDYWQKQEAAAPAR